MQNSALHVSMEMIGCCCFIQPINSTFLKKRARHYFALCVLLVIIIIEILMVKVLGSAFRQ